MKYLKQFLLILLISLIGEILHYYINLPVPASIYGMVLLFAALCLKIIKLEQVKDTGKFLVNIMPVMFIPAGVGLMDSFSVLKPIIVPATVILAVTVITVMFATGKVSDAIIKAEKKEGK
ncbi:MAG: CidA/LrgA family protein [Clostridia bacterium]|nr:CidA/LrgA family protein [Clostridia bacterium]